MRDKAAEGKSAVIIGGGLTGIETAYALKNLGMNTTIVERENSILPQHLDSMGSEIFINQVQKDGIKVLLSKNIISVTSGEEYLLEFSNGEKLNCHMLVIAIGTKPCLDIFEGTGIKCQRGILVNQYLESSVKDVYAAGMLQNPQLINQRDIFPDIYGLMPLHRENTLPLIWLDSQMSFQVLKLSAAP